ncbi:TonB-dependent receptor plug domain-containing protein [Serratia ureilytica]
MGPENTLILIDGKPASSRNSVRQGLARRARLARRYRLVPPEMIERIEVLRGPAAARYGNGAAGGGVVNIITKKRRCAARLAERLLQRAATQAGGRHQTHRLQPVRPAERFP